MATQLSIANRSLLSIGARAQVSSINPSDGSVEADAIAVLFTPTFEALGRSANWNCLRKSAQLTLLQAAMGTPENTDGTSYPLPEFPWLYGYAYPSDCLKFNYIVPSNPVGTSGGTPQTTISNAAGPVIPQQGQIPYVVSSSLNSSNQPIIIILTNQDLAQGVYNANLSDPGLWDSMFQAAMVASLGAFLVPALSLSVPLMQMSVKTAEAIIAQARTADGNEGVTTMDHLPDWMRARAGAQGYGGYGFLNNGFLCYGYDNMNWPGGTYE